MVCTIQNKEYVLIEVLITGEKMAEKTDNLLIKHKCIRQGIKNFDRGFSLLSFFKTTIIVASALVPTENIFQFQSELDSIEKQS